MGKYIFVFPDDNTRKTKTVVKYINKHFFKAKCCELGTLFQLHDT